MGRGLEDLTGSPIALPKNSGRQGAVTYPQHGDREYWQAKASSGRQGSGTQAQGMPLFALAEGETLEKVERSMRLEDISTGASLAGIEPTQVVFVVATVPLAEGSIQLIYRTPDGAMKERLLSRADEQTIGIATAERPFSFDGDGGAFQLAVKPSGSTSPSCSIRSWRSTHRTSSPPHQIAAVLTS